MMALVSVDLSADQGAAANASTADRKSRALQRYVMLELGPESQPSSGEVIVTLSYSGDAAMLMDQRDAIRYLVPDEGGALWTDDLAAGTHGDRELASSFIDVLNCPESAARNARYLYHAMPNLIAEQSLPEAFLDEPLIGPPETLARCEHCTPVSPEALCRCVEADFALVYGN